MDRYEAQRVFVLRRRHGGSPMGEPVGRPGGHHFFIASRADEHPDEVQRRCLVKNLTDMSLCASL